MQISRLTDIALATLGKKHDQHLKDHQAELSDFLLTIPQQIRSIEELCPYKPDQFLQAIGTAPTLRLIARIREEIDIEEKDIYTEPTSLVKQKYTPLIVAADSKIKVLYCILAIAEGSGCPGPEIFIKTRCFNQFQNYFYTSEFENTRSHLRQITDGTPTIGHSASRGFVFNLEEIRRYLATAGGE